jgi:hypothetical protein
LVSENIDNEAAGERFEHLSQRAFLKDRVYQFALEHLDEDIADLMARVNAFV